jgi:hypothetical protein
MPNGAAASSESSAGSASIEIRPAAIVRFIDRSGNGTRQELRMRFMKG